MYNITHIEQQIIETFPKLDVDAIFPMKVNDNMYSKIEKKLQLSINVYTFKSIDDGKIKCYVLFLTKQIKREHINLLYIFNEKTKQGHYTWIKNFNAFMHDTHNDHHARYYCYKCLHGFTSEELLNGHLNYYNCAYLNCPSRIKFPDEKNQI